MRIRQRKTKTTCPRCGRLDNTVGQLVGCPDCADGKTFSRYGWPIAPVCRLCCPTGHGTRCLALLAERQPKKQAEQQTEQQAEPQAAEAMAEVFSETF